MAFSRSENKKVLSTSAFYTLTRTYAGVSGRSAQAAPLSQGMVGCFATDGEPEKDHEVQIWFFHNLCSALLSRFVTAKNCS
jgi:hypothetical protein